MMEQAQRVQRVQQVHEQVRQVQRVQQVRRVHEQVQQVREFESIDARWDAVLGHDRSADGRFVYAVTSTGVFCRPSCPSRRPRRDRVVFFDSVAAAERAGFRACRRCQPASAAPARTVTDSILRASRYLADHADEAVRLGQLATIAGLSVSHLQRQFKRALGVSPREYQAARRAESFRRELRAGRDVSGALYEAGYGSPSRVYESPPTGRGMPPGTYRRGGAGARIGYALVTSELGWVLVAATEKGVCAVKLGDTAAALEKDLRREFPAAELERDRIVSKKWVAAVVARLDGSARSPELPLDVQGTAFQWRVWRALQAIPTGETRSYSEVAHAIGRRSAARAVARACATNPVCLLVPCHRVVSKGGGTGGYRWGVRRKAQLLAREAGARTAGTAGAAGARPRRTK